MGGDINNTTTELFASPLKTNKQTKKLKKIKTSSDRNFKKNTSIFKTRLKCLVVCYTLVLTD